jgi:hypothetical protein
MENGCVFATPPVYYVHYGVVDARRYPPWVTS